MKRATAAFNAARRARALRLTAPCRLAGRTRPESRARTLQPPAMQQKVAQQRLAASKQLQPRAALPRRVARRTATVQATLAAPKGEPRRAIAPAGTAQSPPLSARRHRRDQVRAVPVRWPAV